MKWIYEILQNFFNYENYKNVFEEAIKFKKEFEKVILSFNNYWNCYYYCLNY